jgi:hypothetical protein
MADVTIDDLPDGGAGLGPDEFEIWRVGTSLRLDLASIAQYANGLLTAGAPTGFDTFAEVAAAFGALGALAALNTVNNGNWSGTDLSVANGGTGASTESAARDNLGLEIGVDIPSRDEVWKIPAGGTGGAQVALTGSTSETILKTISFPAGCLGPNGQLRISILASAGANNANAKTVRWRLGAAGAGLGGSNFQNYALTSTLTNNVQRLVTNRNAQNSQVTFGASNASFAQAGGALQTIAIDTSAAFELVITGQLASAGDTMNLDAWTIEYCYGA